MGELMGSYLAVFLLLTISKKLMNKLFQDKLPGQLYLAYIISLVTCVSLASYGFSDDGELQIKKAFIIYSPAFITWFLYDLVKKKYLLDNQTSINIFSKEGLKRFAIFYVIAIVVVIIFGQTVPDSFNSIRTDKKNQVKNIHELLASPKFQALGSQEKVDVLSKIYDENESLHKSGSKEDFLREVRSYEANLYSQSEKERSSQALSDAVEGSNSASSVNADEQQKKLEETLETDEKADQLKLSEDLMILAAEQYKQSNYGLSAQSFMQACNLGNPKACSFLGTYYQKGLGVEQDMMKTVELNRRACELGGELGCYEMGVFYRDGLGVNQDTIKSIGFFEKACDSAYSAGCYNLGVIFFDGVLMKQDYIQALKFYDRACDLESNLGCASLSLMYINGHGVNPDVSKAFELLEKSCTLELEEACQMLENIMQKINTQASAQSTEKNLVKKEEMQTRYGQLTLYGTGEFGDSKWYLYLDQKLVFQLDIEYLELKKLMQVGQEDVVLISYNEGGNGTPILYKLIAIDNKSYRVLQEEFDVDYQGEAKPIVSNEQIAIPLGIEEGFERTLIYKNQMVKIDKKKVTGAFPEDGCDYVFENYCEAIQTGKCDIGGWALAVQRSLNVYSQDTRFNYDKLSQLVTEHCGSASKKWLNYGKFKAQVCSAGHIKDTKKDKQVCHISRWAQ